MKNKDITHLKFEHQQKVDLMVYTQVFFKDRLSVQAYGAISITFVSELNNVDDIIWWFHFDEAEAEGKGLKIYRLYGSGCCTFPPNDQTLERKDADIIKMDCSDDYSIMLKTDKGANIIREFKDSIFKIYKEAENVLRNDENCLDLSSGSK